MTAKEKLEEVERC